MISEIVEFPCDAELYLLFVQLHLLEVDEAVELLHDVVHARLYDHIFDVYVLEAGGVEYGGSHFSIE